MRQFVPALRLEEQRLEPFDEVCVYSFGVRLNDRVNAGPEKQTPGDDAAPWEEAGATWVFTDFGSEPRLREVEAAIDAGPGE